MAIDFSINEDVTRMEDVKVIILKENGYEGMVLELDDITFENNTSFGKTHVSIRKNVTIKGFLSGDTEKFTVIKGAVPDKVIEHILAWQRVSNSGKDKK